MCSKLDNTECHRQMPRGTHRKNDSNGSHRKSRVQTEQNKNCALCFSPYMKVR
jgi:hypothetical protein